jgi:hypothetical protein
MISSEISDIGGENMSKSSIDNSLEKLTKIISITTRNWANVNQLPNTVQGIVTMLVCINSIEAACGKQALFAAQSILNSVSIKRGCHSLERVGFINPSLMWTGCKQIGVNTFEVYGEIKLFIDANVNVNCAFVDEILVELNSEINYELKCLHYTINWI